MLSHNLHGPSLLYQEYLMVNQDLLLATFKPPSQVMKSLPVPMNIREIEKSES